MDKSISYVNISNICYYRCILINEGGKERRKERKEVRKEEWGLEADIEEYNVTLGFLKWSARWKSCLL